MLEATDQKSHCNHHHLDGDEKTNVTTEPPLVTAVVILAIALALQQLTGCASMHGYSQCMEVPVTEYCACHYPDDPSPHGTRFGCYQGRKLTLVAGCDGKHFNFIFESDDPRIARIVFRDVDVSLMTPGLPEYVRGDKGLERIAVVDRQWNRQQVQFEVPGPNVEVTGGDGYEMENLAVASLAKNCLNAGLWEVLLFVKEDGKKAMYYQGWFTFPMGHYKRIWEANTGLSYNKDLNWYQMEHWLDPAGTPVNLERLRTPCSEMAVDAKYDPCEPIVFDGEQVRKKKTSNLRGQQTWKDVQSVGDGSFATFLPPGRYHNDKPWGNEFWRLAGFEGAVVRSVQCPARPDKNLHEIELVFRPNFNCQRKNKKRFFDLNECFPHRENNCGCCAKTRIIVGGIDLDALPVLPKENYSKGLYMPMGIGVPPFYQSYEELLLNPPAYSPYYSFVLNESREWLDHHKMAVDGPVLLRDADDPDLVHMYLLSYERHIIVGHVVLPIARSETSTEGSFAVVPPRPTPVGTTGVANASLESDASESADKADVELIEHLQFP